MAGIIVRIVLGIVVAVVIAGIPWWMIFKKAGYPGATCLLLLIPLVNIGVLWWFAFTTWPVERRSVQTTIEQV